MRLLDTLAAHAIPYIPRAAIRKISRRYIAGDTLADAVTRVRVLNNLGFSTTLDVLGKTVSTLAQADRMADEYIDVLDAIQANGLSAGISIKPSALGLMLDAQQCERLVDRILDSAGRHQTIVCIDMEDVTCTQKEIDLFRSVTARHGNVGLALQAYLRRTYEDIGPLLHERNTLRICKGIHVEDRSHLVDGAWNDRRAINTHFLSHVSRCLETGTLVGIATHDTQLVDQIIALARDMGVDNTKFEFQMLLGVCEPLRDRLLGLGFNVRIYVPYGRDWYGYSTRRLKENPAIAGHVLRALTGL
ncbi:proline dehydrogenase family protein [Paraburkholderia sp. BCC1885]|uniref:proline dehydrogenase family protein n=1 Tax=Paraburkholderia sp. BCC1885 TaxID=2562669 RepID=UPI001183C1AB|nr:proline dehydrogenase family protein [Paraburkholderia sp. BCC1885]